MRLPGDRAAATAVSPGPQLLSLAAKLFQGRHMAAVPDLMPLAQVEAHDPALLFLKVRTTLNPSSLIVCRTCL